MSDQSDKTDPIDQEDLVVSGDRPLSIPGELPVLPLRAGRHLAAWLVWHTTHVSLLEDATEPADRGGSAHPAG